MIIKSMLYIIVLLFIIYRYGKLVEKFIGQTQSKIVNTIIYGTILFFASNQIILTPCIILHTSFKVCCILNIVLILTLIVLSFLINRGKESNKNKIDLKKYINNKPILDKVIFCIMIALIIFQIIATVTIFTENADDSYYVSLTTTSIDSENIYMEEPSMGYSNGEYSLLTPLERIPSYELSVAIFSKIFNLNPTIIYHTLIPIIFIGISYISYYYFANTILNKRSSKIFIIFLSVIFIFTCFSTKFKAGCLLYKIWQGKALFINIILNVIIASLLRMISVTNKADIIILFLANLAAVHLSSTSIFIVSFVYLSFGILKIVKLKIKDIGNMIITFIPILIYVIILVVLIKNYPVQIELPREQVSIKYCLTLYGSKAYILYYLVSLIVIALLGSKRAKIYFLIIQLINLITIWNPFLSNIIAKYLTSSATFWRVLWLLPIETSIAYAITILLVKGKNKNVKMIVIVISLLLLIINGKFAYKKPLNENAQRIPQYIIEQTNYILQKEENRDDIVVLAPSDSYHSCMMRQLTSKIKLICSRELYKHKINNQEIEKARLELEQIYDIEHFEYSIKEFNNKLIENHVDWIIVNKEKKELVNYVEQSIMNKETTIQGYILYRMSNVSKPRN
ncbi:MAG: hypothetical protein HFJ55_05965 [Clostridia bacterium]|nr:hypothetical protein [Clostridia bacterium]